MRGGWLKGFVLLMAAWAMLAGPVLAAKSRRTVQPRPAAASGPLRKIALIIANEDYTGKLGRLPGTRADAERLRSALAVAGFADVRVAQNLDKGRFKREIADFVGRLQQAGPETIGFLYYAGHGMVDKTGQSYLVPVDADIRQLSDLQIYAEPAQDVLDAIGQAGSKAVIVVFDACRTVPAFARGSRGIMPSPPTQTLVAYSTQPGDTASDAGFYSKALAEALLRPGAPPSSIFSDVTTRVLAASSRQQRPQFISNLESEDELALVPGGPGPDVDERPGVVTPPQGLPQTPTVAPPPQQEQGVSRDCSEHCPEMVLVPSGSFLMGSSVLEAGRSDNEGPVHRVEIGSGLWVGKYPITVEEYAQFLTETNHDSGNTCWVWDGAKWAGTEGRNWRSPGFEQSLRDPVVCVSYEDAQAYVSWLSQKTGKRYRLLTESEYEYVNRGGTTSAYWWGDEIGTNHANCNGCGSSWDNRRTSPVGSFGPNAYGLYDTSGNAWSWVADCYADNYSQTPRDGTAITTLGCTIRVLRGGSWYDDPRLLRSARRGGYSPGDRVSTFGFRVARTN